MQDRHIARDAGVLQLANALAVIAEFPRLAVAGATLTVVMRLSNVADAQ